jgi:metal-responsive CopG/Arc/MetJ family transcriptional regulator
MDAIFGGRRMSRRRSTDKHEPMTISLPGSMVKRLDQELSFKQSRSKWVQSAIKAKLDASESDLHRIEDLSSLRLCAILLNRQVISPGMFETLQKVIEAMS